MMFLAFVTVGVFEKTPKLISNSSHLHSGSNFVVEFEVFLYLQFPVRSYYMQSCGSRLGIKSSLETA